MNISSKYLVVFLLTIVVSGCGGGSSGESKTPSPASSVASSQSSSEASSVSEVSSLSSISSMTSLSSSVVSSSSSSVSSSSSTVSSSSVSSRSSSSSRVSSSSVSSVSSSQSSISISSASSTQSSSSSSVVSLASPQNVAASTANQAVSLQWSAVQGATAYHIYYATEPNISAPNYAAYQGGTWVQQVNSPHVITGLTNGQIYYFVVTAINAQTESLQSAQVSATPQNPSIANQPTAQEVLVLELVNRARFDPDAEAARYGIGLNDGGVTITPVQKPPLAHNTLLIGAARGHSQWMLDNDVFSHTGAGNSTPTQRMTATGYSLSGSSATGENIAWRGTTGNSIDMTQMALLHHEALFKSSGHRVNILNANFRELGIGQLQGMFLHTDNTNYLSSMVTQNFARSGNSFYLTGVVYQDSNNDDFYTVGEGLSGMIVSVNGSAHSVLSTGAYTIPLANGTYTVTVSGASLSEPEQQVVVINNANRKLDFIKHGATVDISYW